MIDVAMDVSVKETIDDSMIGRVTRPDQRFADLENPRSVWVVGAINGMVKPLQALHEELIAKVRPGDRLVYTGNYIGESTKSIDVISEILDFRRRFLAITGVMAIDHVMLRGPREEMIDKLTQIQFAPDPAAVVDWMISHHIGPLIESYGLTIKGLRAEARSGVMALTKWTADLRHHIRQYAGHDQFFAHLRRAAFTSRENEQGRVPFGVLIVPTGLDPSKGLGEQTDEFWWAPKLLGRLSHPYAPFNKIIRGVNPAENAVHDTGPVLSIDTHPGPPNHGPLTAVQVDTSGEIMNQLAI